MNITICFIDAWNIFFGGNFFFFFEIGEKSESFQNFRRFQTPQNFSVERLVPHSVGAVHGCESVERLQPRAWPFSLDVSQKKKTETTSNLLFFYLSPVIVDTTAAPALYVVAQ